MNIITSTEQVQPTSVSDGLVPSPASRRLIDTYLKQRPDLVSRYQRARQIRKVLRKSNNYDLTSRCNLFCEGCFYFEGDDYKQATEESDDAVWGEFFRQQAAKGVTFGFFAGAEPALAQQRLLLAAEHIPRGSVHTNGTIRIHPDIPYSIQISVWGDENTTKHFRGGNVFWKSIRNFAGDPRVRFVFTVNPHNLSQIPGVVRIMDEYGHRIMFNYFSPTQSYLDKLVAETTNDKEYFRFSSRDNNMLFADESLLKAREVINEMIVRYPRAVLQTRAFNDALTTPQRLYNLDENGIATNCNGRNFDWHQGYRVDLKPSNAKCCMPNVNCSQCRLYTIAIASFIFQPERFLHSIEGFCDWLDICDQFARVCLLDTDKEWTPTSETLSLPRLADSSIAPLANIISRG